MCSLIKFERYPSVRRRATKYGPKRIVSAWRNLLRIRQHAVSETLSWVLKLAALTLPFWDFDHVLGRLSASGGLGLLVFRPTLAGYCHVAACGWLSYEQR